MTAFHVSAATARQGEWGRRGAIFIFLFLCFCFVCVRFWFCLEGKKNKRGRFPSPSSSSFFCFGSRPFPFLFFSFSFILLRLSLSLVSLSLRWWRFPIIKNLKQLREKKIDRDLRIVWIYGTARQLYYSSSQVTLIHIFGANLCSVWFLRKWSKGR